VKNAVLVLVLQGQDEYTSISFGFACIKVDKTMGGGFTNDNTATVLFCTLITNISHYSYSFWCSEESEKVHFINTAGHSEKKA